MSRDDLVLMNMRIVQSVIEQIVKYSPKCILVMVTNPVDAMAQLALQVSKFPRNRVLGMSVILDTARFRSFVARELGVSVEDVSALILGEHGDKMVPITRLATVGGVPLSELMPKKKLDAIVKRTVEGGSEIIALLKTGSAFYAPAACTVPIVDSIILDRKRVLPCSAFLEGEYGISGVFVGVPLKLGKSGIEKIIEVKLMPEEIAALQESANAVMNVVNIMKL
jgi:malate dehydrogenase